MCSVRLISIPRVVITTTMKLLLIVILFICAKADDKVKVSVYYETLCPDSIAFISDQLYVNYDLFKDSLIQLELIPYGFAKEIDDHGNKTFTCQHGVNECYGNLIHGIAIATQPITTSAQFVYCAESNDSPASESTLKSCAETNGISWSLIEEYQSNGKGADIMSDNGKKTVALNPNFIPTIVFNDKFNQEDQDQAISDFKGVICKYLNNTPDQCNSRGDEVKIIQI